MWKDPIVEEIHAIREQIAKKCGYDIDRVAEYLTKKYADYPCRRVTPEEVLGRKARDQRRKLRTG